MLARCALALGAWSAGAALAFAQPAAGVGQCSSLLARNQVGAARQCFETAREQAAAKGDRRTEALAHHGLGKILIIEQKHPAARGELEQALAFFETTDDRVATGWILLDLGTVLWEIGGPSDSEAPFRRALAAFEAASHPVGRAETLYKLTFALPPGAELWNTLEQGLDRAKELKNRRLEGLILHQWGDRCFTGGDYACASDRLDRAARLLEETRSRAALARVLTSQGRLYRYHGQMERALALYRQALAIHEELGDQQGILQSTDAVAVAYQALGQTTQALGYYRTALRLARRSGSPEALGRQLAHLAATCNETGDYARAVELLDEAGRVRAPLSRQYQDLSRAFVGLHRYEEALQAAEKAVAAASEPRRPDMLVDSLYGRALAKDKLGRAGPALADAEEALAVLEQIRARLVPIDYMKGGFGAQYQRVYSFLIGQLHRAGRHDRALEIAEQGRARAFLDLLATRDLTPRRSDHAQLVELREVERGLRTKGIDPAASPGSRPVSLVSDAGEAETASLRRRWEGANADLKSLVAAPPFSAAQAGAAATRLRSTVLAYWVGEDATYLWVV
ncbi:MAG: tetratricopeptide repeat protein, partial [Acidobacteria bacterium]